MIHIYYWIQINEVHRNMFSVYVPIFLKFCILLYQSFWEVISIKRILNVFKINDASALKCNINTKESVTKDL